MNSKKTVLYDSRDYDYDHAFEDLLEQGFTAEEVTDDFVYNHMYSIQECAWDDIYYYLGILADEEYLAVAGTLGLWNRQPSVAKIIDDKQTLRRFLSGYDDIRIVDDNGRLFIDGLHHDGTNSFEIKVLTSKGIDYLIRQNDADCVGYEQISKIFNCNFYSKLPRLAHRLGFN